MERSIKTKPKAKIEHLINWYHGNFCVKHEDSTREHYDELKKIAKTLSKRLSKVWSSRN